MKSKIILVAIIIVGLGITYYFLYWYNYNEANDTMSLVMPKFMLAYAKQNNTAEEDPFVQAARIAQQELNARGNATTKDAPEPILYNSIPEGDIPPFPMEGQIEIEILASGAHSPNLGWRGNIAYKGGANILSFDGIWNDYIIMNCVTGEPYSMFFQKTDAEGYLDVKIRYRDADYDKQGSLGGHKILDEARTEAAFGIVQLSGECPDYTISNEI